MLFRVEHLEFHPVQGGPRAGRRIAAANQVVDEIHVVGPVDARLALAAPAFIAGLRLVLHQLLVLAGHDQVGRLDHGGHAHGKQAIEVDRAQRVVGADLGFLLQHHVAFVEAVVRAENRQARLGLTLDDGPVDRGRPSIFRQQRGVVLDRPVLGDLHEFLRRELQHERHNADINSEFLQFLVRLGRLQRRELEHLHPLLLCTDFECVGPGAGLLGRAEYSRNRIATGKKGLKDGFAEILLADDCNFHVKPPSWVARRGPRPVSMR